MVDEVPRPVEVSANAGLIDGVQAALRLVAFLIGVLGAVLGFVRARDLAGLAAYVQTNAGDIGAAISGLIGFAAAAYGVFKTRKRGAQLAALASDPAVPETSATLK